MFYGGTDIIIQNVCYIPLIAVYAAVNAAEVGEKDGDDHEENAKREVRSAKVKGLKDDGKAKCGFCIAD
jgi:hypothetical protein